MLDQSPQGFLLRFVPKSRDRTRERWGGSKEESMAKVWHTVNCRGLSTTVNAVCCVNNITALTGVPPNANSTQITKCLVGQSRCPLVLVPVRSIFPVQLQILRAGALSFISVSPMSSKAPDSMSLLNVTGMLCCLSFPALLASPLDP